MLIYNKRHRYPFRLLHSFIDGADFGNFTLFAGKSSDIYLWMARLKKPIRQNNIVVKTYRITVDEEELVHRA